MYELDQLERMTVDELRKIAAELHVPGYSTKRKQELCMGILARQSERNGHVYRLGLLEVMPDGRGIMRVDGYTPNPQLDVYVADTQIRRFDLRTGDLIGGPVRPPKDNSAERYWSLLRVQIVNGRPPERARQRPHFQDLTPIYPNQRLRLETDNPDNITGRLLDIITPIGRGQRGLIISPPKAGKTTMLKHIANCISANHDDVRIMVLLIDERPEEVTDIQRSVEGEVVASTFDRRPENHMRVAELCLERAKRLVEHGEDVVILLDSLTRMARASNLTVEPSGRTLSGGLDPTALYRPKHFFGAARKLEEGGSLTILATILVDTGSRMDEMIYEEFKATGNMDLVLCRELAERGMFPAVDVHRSSTRHQELLFTEEELRAVFQNRRAIAHMETADALETLLTGLRKTRNNVEFLAMAMKAFGGGQQKG
ncbi:MAG: transcription termination factor Rho [Armatimonadetes bacterium]|nr:transcription termination factor Rho [Armatimonadota bacterium]